MTKEDYSDHKTRDGLFVVDQSGAFIYWSDQAERLLGHRSDDVLGRQCHAILPSDPDPCKVCERGCVPITNTFRGRLTGAFDVQWRKIDGSVGWFNCTVIFKDSSRKELIHVFRRIDQQRSVSDVLTATMVGALANPVRAADGQNTLTRRERQALKLLASELSIKGVASAMQISKFTARNHVSSAMGKLGATSRIGALLAGARIGII